MMRVTCTYAILEVSDAAFTEIKGYLEKAGYQDRIYDGGKLIDMQGIALCPVVKLPVTVEDFKNGTPG
jgi:hypothetical protein